MARPLLLPSLLLLPLALLALQRQHGAAAFLLPLRATGQSSIKHQQQWARAGRAHVVTCSSTADVDASECVGWPAGRSAACVYPCRVCAGVSEEEKKAYL